MNYPHLIVSIILYFIIGLFLTCAVASERATRHARMEANSDPFEDWVLSLAVLLWPLWIVISLLLGIGSLVNGLTVSGRKGGRRK